MKATDLPDGIMLTRRADSPNITVTCLHQGCHASTTVAALDDLWYRRFIRAHAHKEGAHA